MHKVWRALLLRKIIVEHLSILWQDVDMRRAIVVTGKHGMSALMLSLKKAEIKAEAILVHMHHKQTATKQQIYKDETTTVMVHAGQIKKTTTLPLPPEE